MGLRKSGKKKHKENRPSGSARKYLILSIVRSDNTFELKNGLWIGKCIFCKTKLVVSPDGDTTATLEHIVPLNHGGTNDLENLALACDECNSEKGRRFDCLKETSDQEVNLLEIRKLRMI
jgi:5-methylcytosine-specific restriction endonuclease McrA